MPDGHNTVRTHDLIATIDANGHQEIKRPLEVELVELLAATNRNPHDERSYR
jgi:hypothetical protein